VLWGLALSAVAACATPARLQLAADLAGTTDGGIALQCDDGATPCGGACVDTDTSAANCGGCGRMCAPSYDCVGGLCVAGCVGGLVRCGASCVDVSIDSANCGQCGTVCGGGSSCVSGRCQCPSGQMLCGLDGGMACVDVNADDDHCGACGRACASGLVCLQGSCQPPCPSGQTACGGVCVDTQTSNAHCGMCNRACPAQQTCVGGTCMVACTNLARSGATASIDDGGANQYGPAMMIDGNSGVRTSFSWVRNSATEAAIATLTWSTPQLIGGFYIRAEAATGALCGTNGRNIASARVEWRNGATWTLAGTIGSTAANHQFSFSPPVTTTAIRLSDIRASGSNSIIHEWYVYPVAGCTPP
jgi:hypothetical protein